MALPRRFLVVFHAGLIIAVALVIRGDPRVMRYLFWLGSAHVVVLFSLGFRLEAPRDRLVVQTLHKTGFLHTLMGLAAAVMVLASSSSGSGAGNLNVSLMAAPMGAALVPHILGLWLGHWIELRNARVDEPIVDLERRLTGLSENTFTLLDKVQGNLKRLNTALDGMAHQCAIASSRTKDALESLRTTASATALSATDLNNSISEIAKAIAQIGVVFRQVIELTSAAIFRSASKGGTRR
jgi:hypothetical protein